MASLPLDVPQRTGHLEDLVKSSNEKMQDYVDERLEKMTTEINVSLKAVNEKFAMIEK